MKNNYLLLAELLHTRRVLLGDSLRSIASESGISHTELARIENGNRENFSLLTLVKICDALNLDTGKLLMATGYIPFYDDVFSDDFTDLLADFVGMLEPEENYEDEDLEDEGEDYVGCEHCAAEESPSFCIEVNVVKEQ